MRLFLVFTFIAFLTSPVLAQETGAPSPSQTRIETDAEKSEIRFYIDGALSAVLKNDGLHVRDGIFYGTQIADVGVDGFEEVKKADDPKGLKDEE